MEDLSAVLCLPGKRAGDEMDGTSLRGLLCSGLSGDGQYGTGQRGGPERGLFSVHSPPVTGAVLTVLVMAVIFGGAGRISAAAVSLVPVSAAFYMGLCAVILLFHAKELPGAFLLIVKDAFSAESAAGGAAGVLTGKAVRYGISRGVFSNEAGLGSLAVLHGEAEAPEELKGLEIRLPGNRGCGCL